MSPALRIGLTGGIGSGKTTVCHLFANLGIPIIDADEISHRLVQPGQPALGKIAEIFGKEILGNDGRLNRQKLRNEIFNNAESKQKLESVLHPLVYEEIGIQVNKVKNPYCIICIPLLIETGTKDIVDRILVIDALESDQLKRVSQRDNYSDLDIDKIIKNQASRNKRLVAADDIIDNTGEIDNLEKQVIKLHKIYLGLSGNTKNDSEPSDKKVKILYQEHKS